MDYVVTKIVRWVFVYMDMGFTVNLGMICMNVVFIVFVGLVSVFVDNVVTVDIFDSILVRIVGCVGIFFPVVADGGLPVVIDIGIREETFFDSFGQSRDSNFAVVVILIWTVFKTIASWSFCSVV